MKKRCLVLILLLIIACSMRNVNAMTNELCSSKGYLGIYCGKNNIPNYLLTKGSYYGPITYSAQNHKKNGGNAGSSVQSEAIAFKTTLNGKNAVCVDSSKQYTFGTSYKEIGFFDTGSFIAKLYFWMFKSEENYEFGQIFFWGLGDEGFFDEDKFHIPPGGTRPVPKQQLTFTQEQFVNKFKADYILHGDSMMNFKPYEKYVLPRKQMYRVIKDKVCIEDRSGSFECEETEDGIILRYEWNEKSQKFEYEYEYTLETLRKNSGLITNLYNASKTVNSQDDIDNIVLIIAEHFRVGKTAIKEAEAELKNMWKNIVQIFPESGVSIYVPMDNGDTKQKIIAPVPEKTPSADCSNYVSALEELGITGDALFDYKDEIKQATNVDLVKNSATGEVKCADRQKVCSQSRTSWVKFKSEYVGYSPKIGEIWRIIYQPRPESTKMECDCDLEKSRFESSNTSSQYYKDCDTFKDYYENIAKIGKWYTPGQVKECNDEKQGKKRFVDCGSTIIIDQTCDSLIGQYGGDRRTVIDRDNLNSRITDPNGVKAILIDPDGDGFGTLKCQPPCDPTVNADNGVCHLKELSKPWFRLSDAELPSGGENMSCILENIAYNVESDIITSKDPEFSKSAYCDVYCWESLYALFPFEPSAAGYVETGRLFFWGTDYSKREFANIGVRRICWSKNINYEQFKTDWNNNEAAIAKAKTAYDNQVSYNAKSGWDSTEACKITAGCLDLDNGEAGTTCCWNFAHTNCLSYGDAGSCASHGDYLTLGGRPASCKSCPSGYHANGTSCEKDGTRYKRNAVGSGDTASTSYDKCLDSAPNESDIDNSSEESSRKSTLEGLIKKRQSLKNAIMGCQSKEIINENSIYKHTATIKLEDEDHLGLCNARGVCNDDLNLKLNIENANVDISSNTIASYFNVSCTDVGSFNVSNPCAVDGGTTIPTYPNSEYRWDYTANESFRYSDNFYFYAQADTDFVANKSMVTEKFNKEKADMYGLTYDMGAGIPTFIEKYSGQFRLNVKVSNLGNDSHFDKILQNGDKYGYDFQKYSCPYDLAKIIYDNCPPSHPNYPCTDIRDGLSVIYRIIDMAAGDKAKVFPGNTGENALQTVNGRRIGSNWASFANTEKFKKITTQDEIYGKKPLYSIELSPTLINEIRRDNNSYRDKKMDPYTSYKDTSNNYKITCTPGNDKSCTSKYITELIQKGKITGRFAEENEEQRRNLIKNYK